MASNQNSPVRCEVRCWERYGSPRQKSTPLRGSTFGRTPLRGSPLRGTTVTTPLRTPRLSWAREQSSLQKWKKSLREMELSDSAKTIKNIQTFKNSQEVIRDQAQKIKVKLRVQSVCQLLHFLLNRLYSDINSTFFYLTAQA